MFVPGISLETDGRPLTFRLALNRTLPFWILSILYLGWFAFLTSGRFFPQSPSHPYHVALSWETILSKHQYVEWAFNLARFNTIAEHPAIAGLMTRFLPAGVAEFFKQSSDFWVYLMGPVWILWLAIKGEWQSLSEVFVDALATPLVVISVLVLVRSLLRYSRRNDDKAALYGFLFFVLVLSPVLMLPVDKTMRHNLYVPVVGLGIVVGEFVRVRWRQAGGRLNKLAALTIPVMLVVAGIDYTSASFKDSWPTTSSRAANKYLEDVQRVPPKLPKGAILYFERTGMPDWPFLTGGGDLFRVFYGDQTLVTMFGDNGEKVPSAGYPGGAVFRFRERDGMLIPVGN